MKKREIRYVNVSGLKAETRDDDSKTPIITGYAAKFNKWTEIGSLPWGFKEKVRKGAFKKTIKDGADVRALWNHKVNYVLGRRANRDKDTLSLGEDNIGLAVEIEPPDTTWVKDLLTSMQRGDVDQMSFGFEVVKEDWKNNKDHNVWDERELIELKLFDVSVVTFPAYTDTDAHVRSILGMTKEHDDFNYLTGLFFKASRGVSFTDQDREKLREHLDLIRSYLPEEKEPVERDDGNHSKEPGRQSEENHSEEDGGQADVIQLRLRQRKRQLELLEAEMM